MNHEKKPSYFGGKRGSGSFQQIITEVPANIDKVIIPFLGNCPVYEFFEKKEVELIGIERSIEVINTYHSCREVINGCGITWLNSHKQLLDPETVIYADPPYLLDSRKDSRKRYEFELMKRDHIQLLEILLELPCSVIISHYPSSLYDEKLKNWRTKEWEVSTRRGMATEKIWMNFTANVDRFTYNYAGSNKTERQRIKRKKKRWLKNLKQLPSMEAKAIISYINKNYP